MSRVLGGVCFLLIFAGGVISFETGDNVYFWALGALGVAGYALLALRGRRARAAKRSTST